MTDESFMDIAKKFADAKLADINNRKEELITAWVAKTGIPPDEASLVHQNPFSSEERFWVETRTDRCLTHRNEISALNRENAHLLKAWMKAERVAEAAASLYSEDGVLDAVSHFNMAWVLKDRIEEWKEARAKT